MKNFYYTFILVAWVWLPLLAQDSTRQYTEEHVRILRAELEALKHGNIELEKEIAKLDEGLQYSEKANEALRATIRSKNAIIKQLELNYAEAKTRAEREKIRGDKFEVMRKQDSVRNAIIIADLRSDNKKLQQLYNQAVDEYKSHIKKLERLIFDRTFRVAAMLRSQPPEYVDTISLFTLDKANSMRVKARQIKEMFIVFETGKDDYELPDYTFSLAYFGKNRTWEEHFKDNNLILNNGVAKHKVDWKKSLIPKAKILKGSYKLIIAYEEDQELLVREYYFTLD